MSQQKILTQHLVHVPEIERKWLIDEKNVLDYSQFDSTFMKQIYIPEGRIRWEKPINGEERYVFTMKKGEGIQRDEAEKLATKEEFLSAQTELYPSVTKTRYYIPYVIGERTYIIELDHFHDNNTSLDGRIVVEIEFVSEDEANGFTIVPDWFGKEVTTDTHYTNSMLATTGWPELS